MEMVANKGWDASHHILLQIAGGPDFAFEGLEGAAGFAGSSAPLRTEVVP